MTALQESQTDLNYEAFIAKLPELIRDHAGSFALLHNCNVVDFFGSSLEATIAGAKKFGSANFPYKKLRKSRSIWGSIRMLAARGRIENRQAIVKIGFQPFVPETFEVQPSSPTIIVPVHEYRALIDTGAQRTCLSRSVIAKEGLRHHGKRPIQNVHGVERHYL